MIEHLEYARPSLKHPASLLYAKVIITGSMPLALLIGLVLLFWLTRWNFLLFAGMLIVAGGVLMLFLSVGYLIAYFLAEQRVKRMSPRRLWTRIVLAVLLWLGNFPGVYICLIITKRIMISIGWE